MTMIQRQAHDYLTRMDDWRQDMETRMRAEDGWLTVVGLDWLDEGANTVGSAPDADISLPADSTPERLGLIHFHNGQASLEVTADVPVLVDGVPLKSAILHDDSGDHLTRVKVGTVTFFVIKRGNQYGVRVRDANSQARRNFTGRIWFPVDESYRVTGRFIPHDSRHTMPVDDVIGITTPMSNPGAVAFELHGQTLRLEALKSEDQLWFVFRDATSGVTTYGASRFLKAPLADDGTVDLDFNQAYHPPCYFTAYATCPLPPRANILPVAVEAGERLPE